MMSAAPSFTKDSVLNAASFLPRDLPGGSIAQGSIFTIFGTGLGPDPGVNATEFPLQTELAGISVTISDGAKAQVSAIPLFGKGFQINAIMPSDAPLGEAMMTVTFNDETSEPVPVNIVPFAVGVFTATSLGVGPGSITNFFSAADQPLNTAHATIQPGGIATFWSTGVGGINAPDNLPPLQVDAVVHLRDLNVIVGDVPVTRVLYAGRSAQFPGLDQVIVELDPATPTGCYVPAVIGADGVFSNYVSLAISADGETCGDEANPFSETLTGGGIVGGFGAVRTEFNISPELMAQWTGAALGSETLGKGISSILSHFGKGAGETVTFKTDAVLTKFSEASGNGLDYNPVFSWPPRNTFSAAVVRGITFAGFFGGDMIPFPTNMPGSEIGTIQGRSFPSNKSAAKGSSFLSWDTWTNAGEGLHHFQEPALFRDVDLFNDPNPDAGPVCTFFSFLLDFLYGESEPSPFSSVIPRFGQTGIRFDWEMADPTVQTVILWGMAQLTEEESFALFCAIVDADLGTFQVPNHVLQSVGMVKGTDMILMGGVAAMPETEEPGFLNFLNDKTGQTRMGSIYNVAFQYLSDYNKSASK
jgi:uncharacterized protein (TIGR03437 family)